MKLDVSKSKINVSAPFLASLALKFARNPKRIRKFASALNARVDMPGLTEDQEQLLLEATIGAALDAADAAINGKDVLSVLSRRDTTLAAVTFVRDNIEDFLGEGLDIPFVPEWIEGWAATTVRDLIDERVIPWIETAQRLQ